MCLCRLLPLLFCLHHTPFLIKRDPVLKDFVIAVFIVACVSSLLLLPQCRIAGRVQLAGRSGIFDLEDGNAPAAHILDNNIAAAFSVLTVGFHLVSAAGENTGQKGVIEILLR